MFHILICWVLELCLGG